jgi:hypothetical protein
MVVWGFVYAAVSVCACACADTSGLLGVLLGCSGTRRVLDGLLKRQSKGTHGVLMIQSSGPQGVGGSWALGV